MVTTKIHLNRPLIDRWINAWLPILTIIVGIAGTLMGSAALAQSGKFSYVFGSVYVQANGTGNRVPVTRGMNVNAGDLVVTLADGMAQLSMIDEAKISLRSNSQIRIERYTVKKEGGDGAILSLLSGTLRTFTGLLSSANRDKYQMKTRTATVGIRGSGNILQHSDVGIPTTLNYTIEGSHEVKTIGLDAPGLITRPDQTVRVQAGKLPEFIPTPASILSASAKMIGDVDLKERDPKEANKNIADNKIEPTLPVTVGTTGNAGPGVTGPVLPPLVLSEALIVPNEPTGLRDFAVAVAGSTYSSQALPADTRLEGAVLRGLQSYAGLQTAQTFGIQGGTAAEVQTVDVGNNTQITVGRWANASGFSFTGTSFQPAGSVHFAYGGAGYPSYLSDVLTGTVSYTRVAATSPTNQLGTLGSLTSSILDVNFTQRTLNTTLGISMPSTTAGAAAETWTLQATNLPFTANRFFAATGLGLTITNRTGQNSNTNDNLFGSLEGSFVGAALNGAIIGYGFVDATNPANTNTINGVVAFRGPVQNIAEPYRTGLVSDPTLALLPDLFARSFGTTNRPAEVTADAQGRVTAFAAPYVISNNKLGHQSYQIGTAQVADAGFDAATGMVWGRWSGGSATIAGQNAALANRSLHYIFSSAQSGPVALPLTGTANYDVIGSTNPTDLSGNTGRLNSAALNANFTARTVDTSLNLTIAGQTWNASTVGAPINRDQYFSAFSGGPNFPGLPRPAQLLLSCTPSCTPNNPVGSLDGFFTGRTGNGAAVMYNLNNAISGAIAFKRRGG